MEGGWWGPRRLLSKFLGVKSGQDAYLARMAVEHILASGGVMTSELRKWMDGGGRGGRNNDRHGSLPVNSGLALCEAAQAGDSVRVQSLIGKRAPVNMTCDSGLTPLHYATEAAENTDVVVKSILDARADVSVWDPQRVAAIEYAVGDYLDLRPGAERDAAALLRAVAALARADRHNAESILDSQLSMCSELRDALRPAAAKRSRAVGNARPARGSEAAQKTDVVQGATTSEPRTRIDDRGRAGRRGPVVLALCEAAQAGDSVRMQSCIGARAPVSGTCGSGRTPLHYATAAAENTDVVVKMLLDARADVSVWDPHRVAAIEYAVGDYLDLRPGARRDAPALLRAVAALARADRENADSILDSQPGMCAALLDALRPPSAKRPRAQSTIS